MDQTRVTKKNFDGKPEDGMKVGRATMRRLEDAENYL
jgi:hypothetical protein